MRIALTLGFTLLVAQAALAQSAGDNSLALPAATAPTIEPVQPANPLQSVTAPAPETSVKPQALSPSDVALYRQVFLAERNGEISKAKKLLAKISDPILEDYAEAARLMSAKHVTIGELTDWLAQHRDLAVADRIYRLAVAHSTKKVRKHHKTTIVAVVTNIPAPLAVPRRTGGFEDQERPEPIPSGEAGRGVLSRILADIKAGQPDAALALLQGIQASGTPDDIAILSHRIAASYLAEGMDAQAFQLAAGVPNTSAAPQLEWDAGFAAYRLGRWADAAAHLEKLAQNGGVQGHHARPGCLLGGARAYAGRRTRARAEPACGRGQGRTDLLRPGRGTHARCRYPYRLFRSGPEPSRLYRPDGGARGPPRGGAVAGRAKAKMWAPNSTAPSSPTTKRSIPAMAALARDLGITNIELRASEASVARGLLLTGLFPVPPYQPEGGYHIDNSLVLAFARIESRFQNGSTSVAGAHGIMQLMPATAKLLAGPGAVAINSTTRPIPCPSGSAISPNCSII